MSTRQPATIRYPYLACLPALIGGLLGAQGLLTPGAQSSHGPTLPPDDHVWFHLIGALFLTLGLLASLYLVCRRARRARRATAAAEDDSNASEEQGVLMPQRFSLRTLVFAVLFCASLAGLLYRGKQWQLERVIGSGTGVFGFFLSVDGSRLLTSGGDGTFRVWEVETGKELSRWPGNGQLTKYISLSPDNGLAASLDANGVVQVRQVADGQEVLRRRINGLPCRVRFSLDGKHVAAEDEYAVWEIATGKQADPQSVVVYGRRMGYFDRKHSRLLRREKDGVGVWANTWSGNRSDGFPLPELILVMLLPAILSWSVEWDAMR